MNCVSRFNMFRKRNESVSRVVSAISSLILPFSSSKFPTLVAYTRNNLWEMNMIKFIDHESKETSPKREMIWSGKNSYSVLRRPFEYWFHPVWVDFSTANVTVLQLRKPPASYHLWTFPNQSESIEKKPKHHCTKQLLFC